MTPASAPASTEPRVLVVVRDHLAHASLSDLPRLLTRGDLLAVNDSGTLPASLRATALGKRCELRLAQRHEGPGAPQWTVAVFGDGDHQTPTEHRKDAPELATGDTIALDGGAMAEVVGVDRTFPRRILRVQFLDVPGGASLPPRAAFTAYVFRHGRPVQYAHVPAPLAPWDIETPFAARPWSVEAPSAGLGLTASTVMALHDAGVSVATLTHGAGLSSIGDKAHDERLPLPERYSLPPQTVHALSLARREGRRVVAVGTTVVRALEGAFRNGDGLDAGEGETDLILDRDHRLAVVAGVLTGLHEAGTSHGRLLEAFASASVLDAAMRSAHAGGYRTHEFGDRMLLWATKG